MLRETASRPEPLGEAIFYQNAENRQRSAADVGLGDPEKMGGYWGRSMVRGRDKTEAPLR
jgi:hypothetical protein